MADAALLDMEPEVGLTWQRYPSVRNIQRTLKVDEKRAKWLHDACRVEGDLRLSILLINDMARALMDGEGRMYQIMVAHGKVVNLPVEWKRR